MGSANRMGSAGSTGANGATRGTAPSPAYFKPQPSEIEYGPMKFLITDRPSDLTIHTYLEELQKHNAKDVVRVCQPTYETGLLAENGISVFDWEFDDGSPPPKDIREKWLNLCKDRFKLQSGQAIAVHCVAGLGRAPVLVAIALMEAGMKYEDCVEAIRSRRRGALNQRQLNYLEKYKPTGDLKKMANGNGGKNKQCSIM